MFLLKLFRLYLRNYAEKRIFIIVSMSSNILQSIFDNLKLLYLNKHYVLKISYQDVRGCYETKLSFLK